MIRPGARHVRTTLLVTSLLAAAMMTLVGGCSRRRPPRRGPTGSDGAGHASGQTPPARPGDSAAAPGAPARPPLAPLAPGDVYVYDEGTQGTAAPIPEEQARHEGRLVVDLSDGWAPFILQDSDTGVTAMGNASDAVKANPNRQSFTELANDRVHPEGRPLDRAHGEQNFLEPFGIPPTLSVLRARVDADSAPQRRACQANLDLPALRAFSGAGGASDDNMPSNNLPFVDRETARRQHAEAVRDASWLDHEIAAREAAARQPYPPDAAAGGTTARATWTLGDRMAALAALRAEPDAKLRARVQRAIQGVIRTRAVGAVQARLGCEGLLSMRQRFTPGMFDLPTHEALAQWERKNDIFGWASLGGETVAALMRPPLALYFDTFKRILSERVADAAGIIEDGSSTEVPNVIADHVDALLRQLHVSSPDDMVAFLRQHEAAGWATLRVAMKPPALPPYYAGNMELSVEIDRGDIWYDLPFDGRGRVIEQPRAHYPQLTVFVNWQGQKVPLCHWRTTIGSWRSETHANGKVYYKYKNSDVGPRFWKHIVAGPVWIPPDGTPAKDLLTRRVLDLAKGPETVVNTEVMGPGFQSAYGLVMAIHIDRSGFDNQIRTHGSVDYTSIARRFSHGCHRLVNNRAVRVFDFILRRQAFRRLGSMPLAFKRTLTVDKKSYPFELKTRGYYYELLHPIPSP